MRRFERRALGCCALGLWLLLALPPVRGALELTMVRHMLVQLPMLAAVGACIGVAWTLSPLGSATGRALAALQRFNAGGAAGILAASFAAMLWMLPRTLDLARLEPAVDLLKFVTVPAAGLAAALSWRRLPVIARAVVHLEVIATFCRFGWGYLAADTRLCLAYLAEDQSRAGELLLWVGAAYALVAVWRPLWGRPLRVAS